MSSPSSRIFRRKDFCLLARLFPFIGSVTTACTPSATKPQCANCRNRSASRQKLLASVKDSSILRDRYPLYANCLVDHDVVNGKLDVPVKWLYDFEHLMLFS